MNAETTTGKVPASSVRRNKRGFTLTEIAIVLGIIGLILGAIWVAAAAVYNNMRVSKADTEILAIAQGVRGLYANQNSTTGLSTGNLITAGVPPSDMVNGAALHDPWPNGSTTVQPTTDGLGFEITMLNIPQGACVSLLTMAAGNGRDPGMFLANASASNSAPAAANVTVPLNAPVNGATAAGECTSTSSGNQVTFGFSLK